MVNILKKPITIIIIGAIIIAGIFGYSYYKESKKPVYEFEKVRRGDVVQVVSVTGQVKPAENIDLAFERSGKVTQINVKVGDKVKTDQLLATLDNSELKAQLTQAQAALQSQQAKLEEMEKGTRAEEIAIAEANLLNAQRTLADAQKNLENIKNKADVDLRSVYDSTLTAIIKSSTVALNSLFVLSDIQFNHFLRYDQASIKLADAKELAVFKFLGESGWGRASKDELNKLNGGTKATIQNAQKNPRYENIDKALSEMMTALSQIKIALETVPLINDLTSTELINLNNEKNNINTEITTLSSKQQTISIQKSTNDNSIASAQTNITAAQNALTTAEANLALKKAGSTPEQIAQQEALVKQAQANLLQIHTNYNKTFLKAPTEGIITSIERKKGEVTQANSTVIKMINSGNFQIESNVSETEVVKVSLGDSVEMTLDALGPNEKFNGKVVKIDPAETTISGVIYYKVTVVFDKEDDRIKSGMTVNMDIKTDTRENVLTLPYYVIKERDDKKYVLVLENGQLKERIIGTGLEGETTIEIISGLKEGDEVVIEK